MDAKKNNLMDSINTVFKLAIKVQEDYIKYSPFPELSMNEMHIIEAVSKQQFPTMTNVAKTLKVTVGTLTTNVKTIVIKVFLQENVLRQIIVSHIYVLLIKDIRH